MCGDGCSCCCLKDAIYNYVHKGLLIKVLFNCYPISLTPSLWMAVRYPAEPMFWFLHFCNVLHVSWFIHLPFFWAGTMMHWTPFKNVANAEISTKQILHSKHDRSQTHEALGCLFLAVPFLVPFSRFTSDPTGSSLHHFAERILGQFGSAVSSAADVQFLSCPCRKPKYVYVQGMRIKISTICLRLMEKVNRKE